MGAAGLQLVTAYWLAPMLCLFHHITNILTRNARDNPGPAVSPQYAARSISRNAGRSSSQAV